jgi:phosphoserine aminotransferase
MLLSSNSFRVNMMDWRHCLLKGHVRRIAITNVGRVKSFVDDAEKAALLYKCIDESDFYLNKVHPDFRSKMNPTFHLPNTDLDAVFVKESEKAGLTALKGHRSIGGMRASIYNAMPIEGVNALTEFMQNFARKYK